MSRVCSGHCGRTRSDPLLRMCPQLHIPQYPPQTKTPPTLQVPFPASPLVSLLTRKTQTSKELHPPLRKHTRAPVPGCMAYELAASSRRGPMGQSEQVKPLVAWALNAAQVAEKSRSQRSDYGLGGRSSGIKKKRKPRLFPLPQRHSKIPCACRGILTASNPAPLFQSRW